MASPIATLPAAAATAGDAVAVVAATAPSLAPLSALLNRAFALDLPTPPSPPRAPPAVHAAALPSGPVFLALAAPDATASSSAPAATSASPSSSAAATAAAAAASDALLAEHLLALAVSLSGVLLLSASARDFARVHSSGVPQLMAAIERSLTLRLAKLAPVLPTRRLLLIVVRDYETTDASPDQVRSSIEAALEAAFDAMDKPDALDNANMAALFDTQIVLLPNETHYPKQFDTAVKQLVTIVKDANKTYADAGMTADSLPLLAEKLFAAVHSDSAIDLPGDHELRATFACSAIMKSVLDKFRRNTVKVWKASVDAGRIIRNFGAESDKLIQRTLDVYDKDAVVYKNARAYAWKRDELTVCLLSDLYALFAKLVLKARENAYQYFRTKLTRIRINDQVEKNVRTAVKEAEIFFVNTAESLRSKIGNWRFDNQRHELVNHMRDDATERLQLARLQGNYVPHMRAPIAFAFHTLLLAPFGRDSNSAQPNAEEMRQTFDPDKLKQPAMLRSRPRQRGAVRTLRGKDKCSPEIVDSFEQFFEEAEPK